MKSSTILLLQSNIKRKQNHPLICSCFPEIWKKIINKPVTTIYCLYVDRELIWKIWKCLRRMNCTSGRKSLNFWKCIFVFCCFVWNWKREWIEPLRFYPIMKSETYVPFLICDFQPGHKRGIFNSYLCKIHIKLT